MAFALTISKLEEALRQPGCPVCRLGRDAASRAIDAFLWEHVTDPVSRQPIIDAYGFCGEHTRMLVAIEMASSGPVLGVNIIYEQLARKVSRDLGSVRPQGSPPGRLLHNLARRLGWKRAAVRPVMPARGECPGCASVKAADASHLMVLFEVLERDADDLHALYQQADGLCLAHLRAGLEQAGERYPRGARWLVDETRTRLERQSERMLEYIRKNNWQYRDEAITPAEAAAWRQALTFFSGLPKDRFTFLKDEF
ncbi:MAG TPA: DUF6062 family protein [Anaerolinea sp.]|nr:DUF6062 family protein [Anaerolinea sp.]